MNRVIKIEREIFIAASPDTVFRFFVEPGKGCLNQLRNCGGASMIRPSSPVPRAGSFGDTPEGHVRH